MKVTILSTRLLIITVLGSLLFSCSSKVPYGSTYYFPLEPVAKKEKSMKPAGADQASQSQKAVVSVEKVASIAPSAEFLLKNANQNMAEITGITPVEAAKAMLSDKKVEKSLSKKELRQERKEARKALKQAVKEYKHDIKELKEDKAQKELSKNMKIGIILAAVGLILLILPIGYVGYILGTIGLVVGLIMILIDVL